MNTRASLEWSLETVGKLIIYSLILIAVIIMGMKLAEPFFTSAEKDWRSKQNLRLLMETIESDDRESVVLHVPENRVLVGFGMEDTSYTLSDPNWISVWFTVPFDVEGRWGTDAALSRPKACKAGTSCICVMRIDDTQAVLKKSLIFAPVHCERLDAEAVGSTSGSFYYVREGMDRNVRFSLESYEKTAHDRTFYPLILSVDNGPRSIVVTKYDDIILLDPICYDSEFASFYRGCKDRMASAPLPEGPPPTDVERVTQGSLILPGGI